MNCTFFWRSAVTVRPADAVVELPDFVVEGVLVEATGDALTVVAEVIESKLKSSLPRGRIAQTAFGEKPPATDRGHISQTILAIGRQDTDPEGLRPPHGIEILGASSDHLVAAAGGAAEALGTASVPVLFLTGGRDTVISLISGAIWYLAEHDDARATLGREPARIPAAVEELLRWMTDHRHELAVLETLESGKPIRDVATIDLPETRQIIEQRLMLGQSWRRAVEDLRRDCMRTGMIPIINSMAVAGLVSLPGMMTGQILGGTPPVEAVKYQILIMFLIAAGTGFGVISAIMMIERYLFDDRHRLQLHKLLEPE